LEELPEYLVSQLFKLDNYISAVVIEALLAESFYVFQKDSRWIYLIDQAECLWEKVTVIIGP